MQEILKFNNLNSIKEMLGKYLKNPIKIISNETKEIIPNLRLQFGKVNGSPALSIMNIDSHQTYTICTGDIIIIDKYNNLQIKSKGEIKYHFLAEEFTDEEIEVYNLNREIEGFIDLLQVI